LLLGFKLHPLNALIFERASWYAEPTTALPTALQFILQEEREMPMRFTTAMISQWTSLPIEAAIHYSLSLL